MSEGSTTPSTTYRKALRLLTQRVILNKAQSDGFLVDLEDVVDLMSALGFHMREVVPAESEMMETDDLDTIRLEFHCNHSGCVAVLERERCPTILTQELALSNLDNNPISAGVSLMAEQVLGKCLQIISVLNDVDNHQPLKRRQSAGNLPSPKMRMSSQHIRRAESASTLSRETTFVVPATRRTGLRSEAFRQSPELPTRRAPVSSPNFRKKDTPRPSNKFKL